MEETSYYGQLERMLNEVGKDLTAAVRRVLTTRNHQVLLVVHRERGPVSGSRTVTATRSNPTRAAVGGSGGADENDEA